MKFRSILVASVCIFLYWSCQPEENPSISASSIPNLKTVQVDSLIKISSEQNAQPAVGVKYGMMAVSVAHELNNDSILSRAFEALGLAYRKTGQYDSALVYFNKFHDLSITLQDTLAIGHSYRHIGVVMRYTGDITKAYEQYIHAAEIYEKLGDSIELAKAYNAMGVIFNGGANEDFKKALEFFQNSKRIMIRLNDSLKMTVLNVNIAYAYMGLAEYDSAIKYLESNISWLDRNNRTADLIVNLNVMSQVLFNAGDLKTSLTYSNKALAMSRSLNNIPELIQIMQHASDLHLKLKEPQKAIELASEALVLAFEHKALPKIMYSYQYLHLSYAMLERMDSAYHFLNLYTSIRDSITNENKSRQLIEMETKYETEKKDVQIELLTTQQKLSNQRLKQDRQMQIGLTILFLVLLSFAVYFFYIKRKQHRMEEKMLLNQISGMKNQVWKLSNEHADKVEIALEKLNRKMVTPLTSREIEVLELILTNHTNQEISDRLFISVNTVKFHLKNVYDKMEVVNRKEAVQFIVHSTSQ